MQRLLEVGMAVLVAAFAPAATRCASAQEPAPRPPAPKPAPEPARPAPEEPIHCTQFAAEVLAAVDAVLVGTVVDVKALRGTDVVRIRIGAWKAGERPATPLGPVDEVTLLATPRDFFVGGEQLLFLKRFEEGPRFVVHNRIGRGDPDWEAKLACLDQNLALQALPTAEERRRQARKLVYDDLVARSQWTRWHGFHELSWLRRCHPAWITREDRGDLRKAAERSEDAELARRLLALLEEWEQ